MDQIGMKTGVPKKQQRITHQSKQLTTRQTLEHYNIQEHDTVDLSLELHDGTGTTDPTEIAKHNDAPTTEGKPPKRRAAEAGVDVPESAVVDT